MLQKLKLILKKLFKSTVTPIATIGQNSITDGLCVNIRRGESNPSRFRVGQNSIVSGQFTLETEEAKISIGDNTFIGGGAFISAKEIEIGSDILISWGCTFIDTNAHSTKWEERAEDVKDWHRGLKSNEVGKFKDWSNVRSKKITIQDKAWIGFDCKILKGVTVGEGAIIAAGSVVVSDVPNYSVFAGNPAKFVKSVEE